jgi:hypothetical protein
MALSEEEKAEEKRKHDAIQAAINAANIARYAKNDELANLIQKHTNKVLEQEAEEERKRNGGK